MDDFEAPTFSLGLDFESQRPSFSLGVGFDDSDSQIPCQISHPDVIDIHESEPDSQRREANSKPVALGKLDDELLECCDEEEEEEAVPRLKRLKRGPPIPTTPATKNEKIECRPPTSTSTFEEDKIPVDCDDIEDFSSGDEYMRGNNNNYKVTGMSVRTSSSAKRLLRGGKAVTTTAPAPLLETLKHQRQPIRNSSLLERSCAPTKIPSRLTDSFEEEDVVVSKETDYAKSLKSLEKRTRSQDLRRQFNVIENPCLPSPAFDEFCDDYFSSRNTSSNPASVEENKDAAYSTLPPSYQYFENEDKRIERIVRQRLRHFLPISAVMKGEGQGTEQVEIDYLGQFGDSQHPNSLSKVQLQSQLSNKIKKKSASRGSTKRKSSIQHDNKNSDWTTTRNCIFQPAVPRDAGKRRVSASGRWYTDHTGRKVYVTKNGQELAGKAAYMNYKKDNGIRSRKSKKKVKKRAAKKK